MNEERADIMAAGSGEQYNLNDKPAWLKQRLDWFQNLKFGLFIHWGIYSQWGCIESWPLVEEDTWARPDDLQCWIERDRDLERFRRDYFALNRTFNPTGFDPEGWAALAENAGMKYVCFTTKHHDGFCMFDTATTDFRVTHPSCPFHSNPRANITREVFDAFRSRDFAVSCYFSKSDWHCPWYWIPGRPAPDRNPNYDTEENPEIWEKFVQFVHAQVRELMTDYGPVDVLWLDGGQVRPPRQDIRMDQMVAMARNLQPGLIVADRTVGGPHENFITPEQQIPDTPPDAPWESCLTLGEGWSYSPDDTYKPVSQLIELLVDIVAKGGNFLLNISPSPDGVIPDEASARLEKIGRWLDINGEAIYNSSPWPPYTDSHIRFTRREDSVYAILPMQSEDGIAPASITLKRVRPAPGTEPKLLGSEEKIQWETVDEGMKLTPPAVEPPGGYAWVFRIQIPA